MSSVQPQDYGAVLMPPSLASVVLRQSLSLGQWTANTTVTPDARFIADRAMVIREIWAVASAVPSDADGTMLINALVRDASEDADDTIVSSASAETLLTTANEAVKLTLASETSENELTLAAGDTIRFTLVSNSAAIDTNASVAVLIVFQPLASL